MKHKGFTLIEVMIVVAIIAVLASIALPSYMHYALRSHRVEARNTLQTIAQRIEQNYKITRKLGTLADGSSLTTATLTTWGLDRVPISGTQRYVISFETAPTDTSYQLVARAVGPQQKDKCGAFFLNQTGTRQASATSNGSALSRNDALSLECWKH